MISANQHLAAFIEMITAERGVAANTVDGYTRDLNDFLGCLRTMGCALDGITPARWLSAIRQFMKFLVAETVLDETPAFAVAGPKRLKRVV